MRALWLHARVGNVTWAASKVMPNLNTPYLPRHRHTLLNAIPSSMDHREYSRSNYQSSPKSLLLVPHTAREGQKGFKGPRCLHLGVPASRAASRANFSHRSHRKQQKTTKQLFPHGSSLRTSYLRLFFPFVPVDFRSRIEERVPLPVALEHAGSAKGSFERTKKTALSPLPRSSQEAGALIIAWYLALGSRRLSRQSDEVNGDSLAIAGPPGQLCQG